MKQLIAEREQIDAELLAIVTAGTSGSISNRRERKPPSCSKCGSAEHTARTCPAKEPGDGLHRHQDHQG